jgi:hypothetical protein
MLSADQMRERTVSVRMIHLRRDHFTRALSPCLSALLMIYTPSLTQLESLITAL